jgi:outer membrane protein assembly factor BamB/tRNA A-37 threonylcarbamoyl transferase component Bud32
MSAVSQSQLDTRRIATEQQPIVAPQQGTLPPGTVLEERYEIETLHAMGGMAAIYKARDLRFRSVKKVVAVKEMTNAAPNPRVRRINIQNFEREANLLASLSHPAVPQIFDFFTEGSRSYLVMEFIEGASLEDLIEERRRPFPTKECLEWAIEVCKVLAYLHSQTPPVIFRDMKPSNLMLRPEGRIMVIDFGIAKVFEQGQRGTMIGTEGYSPPEQYRGVAEPRGDIYALGATLHHLLTARDPRLEPPFTFHERPIHIFNADVSPQLETAIMKALEYDMSDRYNSAAEMAQALSKTQRDAAGVTGVFEQDSPRTTALASEGDVLPLWTFKCEDEVRSSPRLADGVLFIGSYDNNLYAINASDGSFIWKFPTEGGIASTPCIHEDLVLIGSEDSKLYAISRQSGRPMWAFQTNDSIRSSVRVEYGHAFFGSDDGCLYAVNVQSGRMVWKFQSAGPIRSTPLVVDELVFVGSDDGYIYAVDMRSGTSVKWKYNLNRRVTSSPAIEGNLLIVGSADGHLYGINSRSGWLVWRLRTKGQVLSSPTVVGDIAYVGSVDEHLYAVDATTGRQRWKYKAGGPITSSPALDGETVYVGSNDGMVHAVTAAQGRTVWSYTTDGPVPSSPVAVNGVVYIGSTDHKVYAFPG